jgi:murein DD-endopeptidase MepM/ murein hydrolase activator NlpD
MEPASPLARNSHQNGHGRLKGIDIPQHRLSRRTFLAGIAAGTLAAIPGSRPALGEAWRFGLPIGWPDQLPGDGFWIRHGYACENVPYFPGAWHTGENWFAFQQDTTGALVYAVGAGEVVFVGSDYPGIVVIIRHASDLYSMYGHLDYRAEVAVGSHVVTGDRIGTVLNKTDGRSPSHLHFEIRSFFTNPLVNGNTPQFGFSCGYQCPPGPGYWPMDAPDLPASLGWLNPMHVIGRRAFSGGSVPEGAEVQVPVTTAGSLDLWRRPEQDLLETIQIQPGHHFPLTAIHAGAEGTMRTGAEAYRLWFQIALEPERRFWTPALSPSLLERQTDGRAAALELNLLPVPSPDAEPQSSLATFIW